MRNPGGDLAQSRQLVGLDQFVAKGLAAGLSVTQFSSALLDAALQLGTGLFLRGLADGGLLAASEQYRHPDRQQGDQQARNRLGAEHRRAHRASDGRQQVQRPAGDGGRRPR